MTHEQSTELEPLLPKGWLAMAAEKLEAKDPPVKVTPGTISKVKNAKMQHPVIEEVLFELAEEEVGRKKAISDRISQLKNA